MRTRTGKPIRIAILAAAGWKGAGIEAGEVPGTFDWQEPLVSCPEPLLPLGNGETPVSRLSRQLRGLGFDAIFVAVGQPGSLFRGIRKWGGRAQNIPAEVEEIAERISPWTWEKVNYTATLGIPILIPDPNTGNARDGYIRTLDTIGRDWDTCLLVQADTLFTDRFIAAMVDAGPEHFFSMHNKHDVIWLDQEKMLRLRELMEPWRKRGRSFHTSVLTPEGIKHTDPFKLPGRSPEEWQKEWHDIDFPSNYHRVLVDLKGGQSWMDKFGGL